MIQMLSYPKRGSNYKSRGKEKFSIRKYAQDALIREDSDKMRANIFSCKNITEIYKKHEIITRK